MRSGTAPRTPASRPPGRDPARRRRWTSAALSRGRATPCAREPRSGAAARRVLEERPPPDDRDANCTRWSRRGSRRLRTRSPALHVLSTDVSSGPGPTPGTSWRACRSSRVTRSRRRAGGASPRSTRMTSWPPTCVRPLTRRRSCPRCEHDSPTGSRRTCHARSGRPPPDPIICAHVSARMAIAGDHAAVVLPVTEAAFARHPLVDDHAHGIVLGFACRCPRHHRGTRSRRGRARARPAHGARPRTSLITQTVAHHGPHVVAFRRGELVQARAHAQDARTACRTGDWNLYGPWISANLAQVYLNGVTQKRPAPTLTQKETTRRPVRRGLRLEHVAALRRRSATRTGARALHPAGATADALGLVSPGFLPWRSRAAQAAMLAGDREQAAGLCRGRASPSPVARATPGRLGSHCA